MISFAGGLPASELFPVAAQRDAYLKVFETDAAAALQYGATEGYKPLRRWLAARMERVGIKVDEDQVSLTHGSQQALDLIGKTFLDPGSLAAGIPGVPPTVRCHPHGRRGHCGGRTEGAAPQGAPKVRVRPA